MAGKLTLTTPSDREVVMTRVFDAPRALVYECHTKPELVRRWLLGPPGWSMPVCEIDLRVGGEYRYRWRSKESGHEFGVAGVYREIVAPERIVHTELFDGAEMGGQSLVTTVFYREGRPDHARQHHTSRLARGARRDAEVGHGGRRR
jgi:uncharacterized protein YndB with AHSA1/START domain